MSNDSRACKNCVSFSERGHCAKKTMYLVNDLDGGAPVAVYPNRNSVCASHEPRSDLPEIYYESFVGLKCKSCFYFLENPTRLEHFPDEITPAGCTNTREFIISKNPLVLRPICATDKACEEHITDQEAEIENADCDPELTAYILEQLVEMDRANKEKEAGRRAELRNAEFDADRLMHQMIGKLRK